MTAHDQAALLGVNARNALEHDQAVVELYYWEGLRSREIAEAIGIPAPTARSRIRRATERLKAELDRLGPTVPMDAQALAESFRDLGGALQPGAAKKNQ